MARKNNPIIFWIVMFVLLGAFMLTNDSDDTSITKHLTSKDTFRILASTSMRSMDKTIIDYGKKNGFDVEIDHYGDLEIVDILNDNPKEYDAVWLSNSIWLYMLDNTYLTTDSKSIGIAPVVMGIKRSKAEELGFIG